MADSERAKKGVNICIITYYYYTLILCIFKQPITELHYTFMCVMSLDVDQHCVWRVTPWLSVMRNSHFSNCMYQNIQQGCLFCFNYHLKVWDLYLGYDLGQCFERQRSWVLGSVPLKLWHICSQVHWNIKYLKMNVCTTQILRILCSLRANSSQLNTKCLLLLPNKFTSTWSNRTNTCWHTIQGLKIGFHRWLWDLLIGL